MIKFLRLFFFIVVPFLFCCNRSNKEQESIRVAAAANLRFVMEEINAAFEKETGIYVEMVTASSGKLTAQIKSGAPYDVFLSANYKYPNNLFTGGYTEKEPMLFCTGTLVIWTNKQFLPDSTLVNLMNPELNKIGIANPQNAPYGIAAEELLKKLGLYDSIKSKLVYAENVSQLNQYVLNKVVDMGITAKSAVMAPKIKGIGAWKEIDPRHYSGIDQFFVKLKSENVSNDKIDDYLNFITSKEAKSILNKYGYSIN